MFSFRYIVSPCVHSQQEGKSYCFVCRSACLFVCLSAPSQDFTNPKVHRVCDLQISSWFMRLKELLLV